MPGIVRWALALAVVAVVLAGCGEDADTPFGEDPAHAPGALCPTPTAQGAEPDDAAPFMVPMREGFEQPAVSEGLPFPPTATDGSWIIKTDPDAPEGSNVLFGLGDGDPGFSSLLFPRAGDLADLEFTVSFNMGCVEHPHGVGMVLHVADADDYQIVRYSASESAWDFFTVRSGERTRHPEAQVVDGTDPEPGTWVDLRVTSVDGQVQAYDGTTLVLEFALGPADAASGQVGVFLRGVSDARFDEVVVGPPGLPV